MMSAQPVKSTRLCAASVFEWHILESRFMCRRFIVTLLFLTASLVQAGARSWIKGALHPVYTSMYLFLEDIDPQIYYQVLGAIIHPHFTHFSCALYVANASSNWQMGTSHEDNNLNDAFRYVALAHRMDNSVSACLCIGQ